MGITCLGCGKPYKGGKSQGWRFFYVYGGPTKGYLEGGIVIDGLHRTLTGSACPKCSNEIYTSRGYEKAVKLQYMKKALTT